MLSASTLATRQPEPLAQRGSLPFILLSFSVQFSSQPLLIVITPQASQPMGPGRVTASSSWNSTTGGRAPNVTRSLSSRHVVHTQRLLLLFLMYTHSISHTLTPTHTNESFRPHGRSQLARARAASRSSPSVIMTILYSLAPPNKEEIDAQRQVYRGRHTWTCSGQDRQHRYL